MISVIIPLYNKEQAIERSLRSVLSQDYDDFEVIVVNDGSTDRSAEIVKAIPDSRIVFVEQENGGPSKARNTGVKYSKGDWIVFLDADDELLPNALKNFALQVREHIGYDMYFGRMSSCFGTDAIRNKNVVRNAFRAHVNGCLGIGPGSTLYSRSVVLEYPFNERIRRYEDVEFLFRLFNYVKIYRTNDVVVYRNLEYASASIARTTICEDYVRYIDIRNCDFWERIAKYQIFLSEWRHYANEVNYPNLQYCFRRWDCKIICLFIAWIKRRKILFSFYKNMFNDDF